MPFNYKSPGVYVEELSTGARPIESAGTCVLAMIGLCRETIHAEEMGRGMVTRATPSEPTLVTNWTEFTNTFGDIDQAVPGGYLHDAMYGYFLNGGAAAYVVGIPVPVTTKQEPVPLLPAGEGYLLNSSGQRTVRILTAGPMKQDDDITVQVEPPGESAPENSFNLSIRHGNREPRVVPNLTLSRSKTQRNIVDTLPRETDNLLTAEIIDSSAPLTERTPVKGSTVTLTPMEQPRQPAVASEVRTKVAPDLFRGNAAARTGIAGLEAIDEVTLVACPDIVAAYQWGAINEDDVKAVQTAMLNHCEMMKDRFAVLDSPMGLNVQEMIAWRKEKMNFDSKYGALYYPWIKVDGRLVPPSGHIAGVYARVDGERGIHKAPANETIRGVIGLERRISRNEQDFLNPIAVNCIRSFPNQGIRIWGARTLSSDAQWRYINVRRLFCNVEESILQNTNWIVFEPNDVFLWNAIKRDIGAYLTLVWRSGGLFGATPQEAFYVKCDEETNPKELRDLGYCVIEVGLAPVKPAEFVVFRVSQKEDTVGQTSEA
jgi:hypothetical protein